MRRRPRSTRFPYTTLCRSAVHVVEPGQLGELGVLVLLERRVVDDGDGGEGHAALGADADGVAREAVLVDDALAAVDRSEEHTSEIQSRQYLAFRLLVETKI